MAAGTAAGNLIDDDYQHDAGQREPSADQWDIPGTRAWEQSEYAACLASAAYFTHHYLIIDNASDNEAGSATMPFELWPDQMQVMDLMTTQRLLIFLKARQLGISWVSCAYALWLCVFHPGKVVLIFSKGKMEAQEMVRRMLVLYKRLPEWLKARLPSMIADNTANLEWDNESKVQALAATKDAGSSFTASLVILDEFAKMLWADSLYTAVKPTIDAGGRLFIISTAKGKGNPFHELWVKTEARKNNFVGLFLSWRSRPHRTDEWYQAVLADAKDPETVKQEYPSTPKEAFLADGRPRFLQNWIDYQADNNICEPLIDSDISPELLPVVLSGVSGLKVYKLPDMGYNYVIGTDPAEGLPHSDDSVITVMCAETWEEVAMLDGKIAPDLLAYYATLLGEWYNNAWVNVLRRNHGLTMISELVTLGYPCIVKWDDERFGLDENVKTKPLMVDGTAEALKDHLLTLRSQVTLDELEIYEVKENGTTDAPNGKSPDHAVTIFACVAVLSRPRQESNAPAVSMERRLPQLGGNGFGAGVRTERLNIGRRGSPNYPSRGSFGSMGGIGRFAR